MPAPVCSVFKITVLKEMLVHHHTQTKMFWTIPSWLGVACDPAPGWRPIPPWTMLQPLITPSPDFLLPTVEVSMPTSRPKASV